jgi:hypothetical protein
MSLKIIETVEVDDWIVEAEGGACGLVVVADLLFVMNFSVRKSKLSSLL